MNGDLISRNALYSRMVKLKSIGELTAKEAIRQVRDSPSVDATPREHGKWFRLRSVPGHEISKWVCSECGRNAMTDGDYRQVKSDYCPHCGAKMDGGN